MKWNQFFFLMATVYISEIAPKVTNIMLGITFTVLAFIALRNGD